MARLIDVKGRTYGRSTDRFGDLNFYANIQPFPTLPKRRHWGHLVHDRYVVDTTKPDIIRISRLNWRRAIADMERLERHRD